LLVQLCIFCMMSAVTKLWNGLPCIEVAPLNRERSLHPISSEPGSSTAMVRHGQSGGPSVIHGLIRCADRAVTEDIPSPKKSTSAPLRMQRCVSICERMMGWPSRHRNTTRVAIKSHDFSPSPHHREVTWGKGFVS